MVTSYAKTLGVAACKKTSAGMVVDSTDAVISKGRTNFHRADISLI
jgi:hypothetical protein